jgi:hypothetical protein
MSHTPSKFARLAAAGAFAVMFVTLAAPSEARERGAAGARAGAAAGAAQGRRAGGDWTRSTETQRTENGRTRSDRWEGAGGKTATRDVAVTRDAEAGTRTRDSQWTRPNGASGNATTVATRTPDGYTRDTTVTNGLGQTATRNVEVSRDKEAGTSTRSVDRTGFDGRSASVDSTRTRTDDGFTIDRNIVTPNGTTISRDVVKTCDTAAGGCTTTVTRETTPPAQP